MPSLRVILFAMLCVILTGRSPLPAAPHEPSPAGGGWLDFHSELSVIQSEGPWFPAFPGPLTLEAWLYVDEPPDIRNAFSIVGQTDRFNWAILRSSRGNVDDIPAAIGGIFTPETGMVTAQLPARQWVHYVATIDGGAAVGGGGFLTNLGSGGPLASVRNPLILGGVPVLPEGALPPGIEKTLPTTGVYIDELRISRVVRYRPGEKYPVPTKAFTSDADTLGLYHFDEESSERYEDASEYQIALIRGKKHAESKSNQ